MYYSINGGNVSFGEKTVLSDIKFEIHTGEKIAVVGRNGCGKTTLLKVISGEYEAENGEISVSGNCKIGTLNQIAFKDDSETFENELLKAFSEINEIKAKADEIEKQMEITPNVSLAEEYAALTERYKLLGGYYYKRDYESIVKNFGFTDADKQKRLFEFSGGQRTKIAFMKLLLSKPDVLLLDEPTNHLDINSVEWLENYIKNYPFAVVTVSHDRMFLDRTVQTVYEIERGKIRKYPGNYTKFLSLKQAAYEKQLKDYSEQQKEIERLNGLVEKFRYKKNKAKFAQSKIKYLERMDVIEPPEKFDLRAFYGDITPVSESGGDVLYAENLCIGYDKVLSTLNFSLKKQCKVGIIGGNGLGKSTLLKTLMGIIPPLSGKFGFGVNVVKGYFDQQMAEHYGENTVFDDYRTAFPSLTDTEIRNDLGAFLFSGDDVFKKVSVLSGGERVRLALCKLFKKRPNFLILDEPTNHTDIVGKEALGKMLKEYSGSLICVTHDRYFLKQVCDCLLIFGDDGVVTFFPYSYDEYIKNKNGGNNLTPAAEKHETAAPVKKPKYVSRLKEISKRKAKIEKLEEKIALKEEEIAGLKAELNFPENVSDYEKLSALGYEIDDAEASLSGLMEEWETLNAELEALQSEENEK